MPTLKVVDKGFFTTAQDLGRYGYQQYGIPVSGAADNFAHCMANFLVGNEAEEATLEITMMGPRLEVLKDTLVGFAGFSLAPVINGQEVDSWASYKVYAGDKILFRRKQKKGLRFFMSVAGGIDVPLIMNSRSTYVRGAFGGFEGRNLMTGDVIDSGQYQPEDFIEREVDERQMPAVPSGGVVEVRVVMGTEEDYFTDRGIETFLNSVYQVSIQSDRMGYRFEGETIEHKETFQIISDGIAPGGIQVPGNGQPIVMLWDRHAIGGYTKIATVIFPDLDIFAQLVPGNNVKFKAVSTDEASRIAVAYSQRCSQTSVRLKSK